VRIAVREADRFAPEEFTSHAITATSFRDCAILRLPVSPCFPRRSR
jgi:hypothetical protein